MSFRKRAVGQLKQRAEGTSDPARRARLLERARRGHQLTLEELVAALRRRGRFKLTEQLDGYDLLARQKEVAHLFEVKTSTPGNLATQIRRGWAQLHEYRYRNAEDLPEEVGLYLVFDQPQSPGLWAWKFLVEDCDVVPLWIKDEELQTFPAFRKLLP